MKLFITLILIILLTCSPKKDHTISPIVTDKFIFQVDSILSQNMFNGVILITKDSNCIYKKVLGFSDLEQEIPLKENDEFVIGSISKQITAALILREFEKGTLTLNDKISLYLPDIHQDWAKKISIHQLLTHTHGIQEVTKPLEFEPGTQFHYSQLGYELLAQILEKINSKSFQEISTTFFAEIGLKNTFHPKKKEYLNLVKAYEENGNGKLEYVTNSLENYAAAGSFISTADDLNQWNHMLYSGKVVRKKTLELMKRDYATRSHPIFETIEYGYGLMFKKGEENLQIGATGYAPGFVSACFYYPKMHYSLIILENTARNLSDFKKTFKVETDMMDLISKLN
jgi:D-alanyl-D-alanine carboxypeptidase